MARPLVVIGVGNILLGDDGIGMRVVDGLRRLQEQEPSELPRETLLRIWGEGTFVRIFSLVNAGRAVERDLFEGL